MIGAFLASSTCLPLPPGLLLFLGDQKRNALYVLQVVCERATETDGKEQETRQDVWQLWKQSKLYSQNLTGHVMGLAISCTPRALIHLNKKEDAVLGEKIWSAEERILTISCTQSFLSILVHPFSSSQIFSCGLADPFSWPLAKLYVWKGLMVCFPCVFASLNYLKLFPISVAETWILIGLGASQTPKHSGKLIPEFPFSWQAEPPPFLQRCLLIMPSPFVVSSCPVMLVVGDNAPAEDGVVSKGGE